MITLGGLQVLDGWLRVPLEGAPSGMIELPAALSGRQVLSDSAGHQWVVTVDGASHASRFSARIVCGSPSAQVQARHLRGGTVGAALLAICADAGMSASPLSRSSLMAQPLAHWSRSAGSAADALRDLARAAGCSWRIMQDGSAWLGSGVAVPRLPTWQPPRVLDSSPAIKLLTLDGGVLSVVPGDTVAGQQVQAVRYLLGQERITEVWYG